MLFFFTWQDPDPLCNERNFHRTFFLRATALPDAVGRDHGVTTRCRRCYKEYSPFPLRLGFGVRCESDDLFLATQGGRGLEPEKTESDHSCPFHPPEPHPESRSTHGLDRARHSTADRSSSIALGFAASGSRKDGEKNRLDF